MSFEFTNLSYDSSRKSIRTTQIINQTPDGEKIKSNYMPVPYNMTFQLNIMTKLNDDMLQIIEQILPYFQPHYTLTVKFLGNLEEKRDIPIQLDDITMTDDYTHIHSQNLPVWSCGGCSTKSRSYCWLPGRHHPWCSLTLLLKDYIQQASISPHKSFLFGPVEDVYQWIHHQESYCWLHKIRHHRLWFQRRKRLITFTVTPKLKVPLRTSKKIKDYVIEKGQNKLAYVSDNIDLTTQIIPVGDSSDPQAHKNRLINNKKQPITKKRCLSVRLMETL